MCKVIHKFTEFWQTWASKAKIENCKFLAFSVLNVAKLLYITESWANNQCMLVTCCQDQLRPKQYFVESKLQHIFEKLCSFNIILSKKKKKTKCDGGKYLYSI